MLSGQRTRQCFSPTWTRCSVVTQVFPYFLCGRMFLLLHELTSASFRQAAGKCYRKRVFCLRREGLTASGFRLFASLGQSVWIGKTERTLILLRIRRKTAPRTSYGRTKTTKPFYRHGNKRSLILKKRLHVNEYRRSDARIFGWTLLEPDKYLFGKMLLFLRLRVNATPNRRKIYPVTNLSGYV